MRGELGADCALQVALRPHGFGTNKEFDNPHEMRLIR